MNKHVHKRGPNKGYVSRVEAKAEEDRKNGIVSAKDQPKQKNLFRGLIGGNAYATAKGSRGTALDSMWGQNIFISFNLDDVELLNLALRSSLADVTEVVVGGECGSPFLLGDFGFYSENKFQSQVDLLLGLERKYAVGKYFLSAEEWNGVDGRLSQIGNYSFAKVRRAVRGDTFASLAVRANAFQVAKVLMDVGVDPLLENEENEDLVSIIKEQYGYLSDRLHDVMAHKDETQKRVFTPSETDLVLAEEKYIIDTYNNMLVFIDATVANLDKRIILVHRDRQDKRRAEIRHEQLDPHKLWNANQLDKALLHLKECADVKAFIYEKLEMHTKHNSTHVTMAELVTMQHELTLGVAEGKDVMGINARLTSAKISATESKKEVNELSNPSALYELLGVDQDMSAESSKPKDDKKDNNARFVDDIPTFGSVMGVLKVKTHKTGFIEEQVLYR